jgi:hypothetical protein
MPSLTNISFPPEEEDLLRAAVKHYRFENFNQFFRICAHLIIEHHLRGDALIAPLRFEGLPGVKTGEPNYFSELLRILSEEELLRLRRRFELRDNNRMAEVLTDEIEELELAAKELAAKKLHGKD